MEFKVQKVRIVMKTTIEGKVVASIEKFFVYRLMLFGLAKCYLKITPDYRWELYDEIAVDYTKRHFATSFATEADAQKLVDAINDKPDRFVRRCF